MSCFPRVVSCVVCCMLCAVCCVLSRVCVACQTDRGAQRKTGTPLAKMLTGRMPMPGQGAGSRGRRTRVAATALHTDSGAYVYSYINNAG